MMKGALGIMTTQASLLVRLTLGSMLVHGGLAKLRAHDWWRDLVHQMDILPSAVEGPMSGMLPGIELVAGLALILGLRARSAAWLTAALHLLFGTVMLLLVLRDAATTCGCFGPGSEYPVDGWHLLANVLQMLAALALPLLPVHRWAIDRLLDR